MSGSNSSQRGSVKIEVMKDHIALQALSSWQAQSKHLRIYAKIGLPERGKVMGIPMEYRMTKNNKHPNHC